MTTSDTSGAFGRAPHRATELLRELTQLTEAFSLHLGRELTVNQTDLSAMTHLMTDGPLAPRELAHRLDLSAAAVTTVVDRLERLGHVRRMQHPTDRRSVVVEPTAESTARALSTLMPMIGGVDRVIDEFVPEEQRVILNYLERVVSEYRNRIPDTSPVRRGDAPSDSSL